MTQEVVESLVFLINETLAIENHKLYDTFFHVAFRSQSLLRTLNDLITLIVIKGPDKATKGG
jgi:hypothetical protein